MSPRIPITILSGYLGAGKTTIINRVLSGDPGLRVAVLVNDFGAINIDANLIAAEEEDRISLTNGCVCCSIGDDLGAALDTQAARDTPPEHVLLEASGVAEPKRIAMHAGYWPGFELDALIVAVDAETVRNRVDDKFVGRLVRSQIASAELIALTKTDLIGPEATRDVIRFLRTLTTDIRIIETPGGAMPTDLMFGNTTTPVRLPLAATADAEDTQHDQLQSRTWVPETPLSQDRLETTLATLPSFVHRVKGFFYSAVTGRMILLQVVGRRFSFSAAPEGSQAGLVIIGTGTSSEMDAQMDRLRATAL